MKTSPPNTLARNLRAFFGEYLPELRGLRRHTLLSYRDTSIQLLRFLGKSRHCDVVNLDLEAISPEAVLTFLNHLERDRHNKTSARNVRLAAIHAFFRYLATHAPERLEQVLLAFGEELAQKALPPEDLVAAGEPASELRRVKRRRGRRALANFENLSVTTQVYELSAAERACPGCGIERKEIGAEESWQIEYVPGRFVLIQHDRNNHA